MEVYILDSLLRREKVIDRFESLIWTERFASYGDFQLVIQSTNESRSDFVAGTRIAQNESYRVMTVETVENTIDEEGKALLKVKGISLEDILDDRVAKDTLSDLTTEPKWILTGTPGDIARQIFNDICVLGTLDPGDVIPFIMPGTIFPEDTIPESTDIITVELDPQSVYEAIKGVCDLYDLGFRLVRNFDTSQLYFDIYSGSDRTTLQTDLAPVVFSPDLDNLKNTTEFTTIEQNKNVAYVFSPVGFEVVIPQDVDPEVEGFERRVLLVKADDITDPDPEIASALMIQRGKEELSKNRSFSAFDGELNQHSEYKYGIHYNLGDLVEMRNSDGITNNMRVTEQIFVSDKEGERSYPTLAINLFITPGSWLAWDYNQVWADLGLTEYWENA